MDRIVLHDLFLQLPKGVLDSPVQSDTPPSSQQHVSVSTLSPSLNGLSVTAHTLHHSVTSITTASSEMEEEGMVRRIFERDAGRGGVDDGVREERGTEEHVCAEDECLWENPPSISPPDIPPSDSQRLNSDRESFHMGDSIGTESVMKEQDNQQERRRKEEDLLNTALNGDQRTVITITEQGVM